MENKLKRVLVVDDEELIRNLICRFLTRLGSINCIKAEDGQEAWEILNSDKIDLVITDIRMPRMDGITLLEKMHQEMPEIPVMVITGEEEMEIGLSAVGKGAYTYIMKPFKLQEVAVNIEGAFRRKKLEQEARNYQQKLMENLEQKERQLTFAEENIKNAYKETIFRLALAAEYRDNETSSHLKRISFYTGILSDAMGLEKDMKDMLCLTSQLHDIGKIGIPDNILMKAGKLTEEEFEIIKTHPLIGANILNGSKFPFLQMAYDIALSHHESYDGKGYPQGIAGDDIPLSGRIVTICDVFDALTSKRPYRDALSVTEAKRIILEEMKERFDPEILGIFMTQEPLLTDVVNQNMNEQEDEICGRYSFLADISKMVMLIGKKIPSIDFDIKLKTADAASDD